ncbi:NTP transferase domain-containing protein [Corynebacterium mendelii]|uniref:NTP transferase domain-containing protein n=1 Tax=Corynebacterium mendelii TaxID=2765362 RepID=A0A939IYA9_9CORY|nr:NTP transferase domain-containing protein [Corynebacterium mendelii]MBN9644933.1 NTP transferase domain-containing protein [Corynebacterium mendelii]
MADTRSIIPGLDVIVLAEGPRTNDGVPLSAVTVDGEPLINLTLAEIAMTTGLQQVTVVTAGGIALSPGTQITADPGDGGGPVSAIAAGVRTLWHQAASATAVVRGWAPDTGQLLSDLWAELDDGVDVAVAVDDDGNRVPLAAVWTTVSLWKVFEFMSGVPDPDPGCLFDGLTVACIDGNGLTGSYETEQALAALGEIGRA